MNAILSLWSAIGNLARAVNRMAAAADAVSVQVKQHIPLAGPESAAVTTPSVAGEIARVGGRRRLANDQAA